jgi:hypothetical protein
MLPGTHLCFNFALPDRNTSKPLRGSEVFWRGEYIAGKIKREVIR